MAKDKSQLLREIKQKRNSCRPADAERALKAWGFKEGRQQGHAQVWSYKHITLTLHAPHGKSGGNNLAPGAVSMVIRKIEEADILQQVEREAEAEDVN